MRLVGFVVVSSVLGWFCAGFEQLCGGFECVWMVLWWFGVCGGFGCVGLIL